MLADRPANLKMLGPLRWDAVLYGLPPARRAGQRGPTRKRGDQLPCPRQMIEDTAAYPTRELEVRFGDTTRKLRVQVVRNVLWYTGSKTEPMTVVLVRDVAGRWRDEVLVATSLSVTAEFVISGYCRRWSIEVVFFESKQLLGLHDPQVRTPKSVERTHPMCWFVQTLTVLWYATARKDEPHVQRDRPWYTQKATPTFADMLGALRLAHWDTRFLKEVGDGQDLTNFHNALKNWLAAVR